MAHLGVVSDVWTGCATDPACCCNELTTAPLTVTLQPNGVADADEWLGMAHACPSLGSPLPQGSAWPKHGPPQPLGDNPRTGRSGGADYLLRGLARHALT